MADVSFFLTRRCDIDPQDTRTERVKVLVLIYPVKRFCPLMFKRY